MRTYIIEKMPKCRICGKDMDYWIPGLPNEDHVHDECYLKECLDNIRKSFEKHLIKSNSPIGEK
jgi:hypothetical protein